jgi:DNA repair protein RecO (recombination protein O)
VAKGVRKTKSKFGARLEPTSHVALQLYEGRELDIVTQAESVDHFKAIREDLDRLSHAVTMLEATDQLSLEREPNPDLYRMLLGALRSVDARNSALVVAGFHWKVLALEGFRPQVESCVVCEEPEGLVSFDPTEGGLLCAEHRRGTRVSPEAVELLQQILGGRLAQALDAPASPATHEVDHLATRVMEHHLERRLGSVGLLD